MARSVCIPVLSGHRCGSSAVAGVLFHLGVHMGPVLLGGSKWNPSGHFEDKAFVDLHKRIVGDWRRPALTGAEHWLQYQHLVWQRSKQRLWGVKDPRLVFAFDLFSAAAMSEIYPIHVARSTFDAADSMTARGEQANNPDIDVGDRGFEIACLYKRAIDDVLRRWHGPVLHIRFEQLTADPAGTVGMIADYIGVPSTQEAVSFVHPELRHNWRGHGNGTSNVRIDELQAAGQHPAHSGGAAVAG